MEPMDEEPREHKADLVSKIYVATGVPGIVLFMVVLFSFTRSCGIPACYEPSGNRGRRGAEPRVGRCARIHRLLRQELFGADFRFKIN